MAKYQFIKTTKALNDACELIVKSLKSRLEENFSDASGDLGRSITLKLKSSSNKIESDILMLDYWQALDQGRKAGKQPPIDKIKEWFTYPNPRAKLGLQGVSSVNIAEVKSLAYLISRKIGREGTKGNNFATDVFESKLVTQELPDAILEAVIQDTDAVLTELLDNF